MGRGIDRLFGVQTPEPLPSDGLSIVDHSEKLAEKFTPSQYYEYLRKEIEREDTITNHRLTWAMAFQGFLITSMTFLLSGSWANQPPDIELFRKLAVGAIGCFGLLASWLMIIGVDASRNAIDQVIADWEAIDVDNRVQIIPKLAPRTYGPEGRGAGGRLYARALPRLFRLMWAAYMVAYIVLVAPNLNKNSASAIPNYSSSTSVHLSYSLHHDEF